MQLLCHCRCQIITATMYVCTPGKAQRCLPLVSHALLARDLVVRCNEVDLLLADARVALRRKAKDVCQHWCSCAHPVVKCRAGHQIVSSRAESGST